MKREYIIERQGKQFVLYEGLLDEAHQQGLQRISTTLIQTPHQDNGNVAIVAAEVETGKGIFSGIGDASPGNVNRMIVPHLVRMAETRAKARAMRDAVNVGVTSVEEMGELDEPQQLDVRPHVRSLSAAHEDGDLYTTEAPKPSPHKPASANQLATIAKLSRLLGESESTESMTSPEASDRITELSRVYNERKGSGAARRSA
ncbi:MAG: hypothetical protein ACR2JC_13760 [Chloroflexota bacterium]